MNISEIIKELESIRKNYGDLIVTHSKDDEMNYISIVLPEVITDSDNNDKPLCVCMFPTSNEFNIYSDEDI